MFEEILSITRKLYCNPRKYKYLLIPKICREWIYDPQKVKITLAKNDEKKFLMIEEVV